MARSNQNAVDPGAEKGPLPPSGLRPLPEPTSPPCADEVDGAAGGAAPVQPLNEAAAVYEALAEEIRGRAVGWSATSLALLERGLLERYGTVVGGRASVRRLVRLAAHPQAA